MTSSSTLGTTSITLQFDLSRDINGAARDVEAGINAARTYLARESAGQSDLPQSESGRLAHPGARPAVGHLRRSPALRRSLHRDGAAHLADLGRRRGAGGRRVVARRAHRAQSQPARQLRNQPADRAAGGGRPEFEPGQRTVLQRQRDLRYRRQRSDLEGRRLQAAWLSAITTAASSGSRTSPT